MKIHLLLLALLFGLSPLRADVAIYAGSATQHRPGVKQRTSRAFLVVERNTGSATPHLAILLGGSNASHSFTATYYEDAVNGVNHFEFLHLRASLTDHALETNLDLVGNYTKNLDLLLYPRKYTGRLTATQFPTGIVFIFVPGEPLPPPPLASDFSDISLVFSLDQPRTDTANDAGSTFDAAVAALKARL